MKTNQNDFFSTLQKEDKKYGEKIHKGPKENVKRPKNYMNNFKNMNPKDSAIMDEDFEDDFNQH